MLQCWSTGWVEPVVATPEPRHIAAQQILAAALQTRRVPLADWQHGWGSLPLFDQTAPQIMEHMLAEGFLEQDAGSAFIGIEAEKHFGRRHFMELLAVFTAAPEFTVLAGRNEIGSVETSLLTEQVEGPRVLLLGGRSWQVTHIDWKRRLCYVEASTITGKAKWSSIPDGASFEITRGIRDVLLGATPTGVTLTRRAVASLDGIRDMRAETVADGAFIIARDEREDWRWWTWAGAKANRTLGAWIPSLVVPRQMSRADSLRLHRDLTVAEIREGLASARTANSDRPSARGRQGCAARTEVLRRTTRGPCPADPGRAAGKRDRGSDRNWRGGEDSGDEVIRHVSHTPRRAEPLKSFACSLAPDTNPIPAERIIEVVVGRRSVPRGCRTLLARQSSSWPVAEPPDVFARRRAAEGLCGV